MKLKVVFAVTALVLGSFVMYSFQSMQQQKAKEWSAPDKFKTMKNPVKSDDKSIAQGKALFTKHCKSCHGVKGLGDGPKGASLKTFPGDFSSKAFQSQTDGSLFYKTTEGKDEMPSYKSSIASDNDRWALVNYMRTLKK